MKRKSLLPLALCAALFGGTHASAAAEEHKAPTVTPEGTMTYYEMKAYLYESIGLEYLEGLVNQVYMAPDGKHVYIGSLFPNSFRTADMWLEGTITTDQEGREIITIPCNKPFFTAGWDEIYVGEVWFDEDTYETKVKDITLVKDGDHIYIEDDVNNYSRCLIAYEDDYGDIETVDVAYCVDLKPYTGNTQTVEVPANAERRDYIYYSLDTYGTLTANKGTVAIAPSAEGAGKTDYYFDYLMPNIAPAWMKGTRQGDEITVPQGQFLGADCGHYLYSAAFRPTSYDEREGQYIGTPCDINFSVAADGVITFSTPQPSFITALQNDGKQYDCVYENRIVPYTGDVPAQPSEPTELSYEDYSATSSMGCFAFDFVFHNLSVDNKYLNPDKLGYYIYLDGKRVTFTRDVYTAIHSDEMTLIPFGYTDTAGYDFYSAGGWNEVYVYTPDFESLGVQAVYTVDGVTYESNIATITRDGDVHSEIPVGIDTVVADNAEAPSSTAWYDLQGRKVTTGMPIRIKQGRKQIR